MGSRHRVTLGSRTRATLIGAGVVTAAAALVIGTGAANAVDLPGAPSVPGVTTTVVTPEKPQGFAANDAQAPTFSEDLGGAGGSAGALRLETTDSVPKVNFFHTGDAAPLATFAEKFGYSALRSNDSTGAVFQFPALQIILDFNGPETGGFTTLSFEPVYQSGANAAQSSGEFHTYDATTGVFCSSRQIGGFEANQTRCDNGGLRTLRQIVADNPAATVTAFGVNQGSGNPGIISAVDRLVTPTTVYDFELKDPPVVVVPSDPVDPTGPTSPVDPTDPGTEPTTPGHGGNTGGGSTGGNTGNGHDGEWGSDGSGQGGHCGCPS